MTDTKGKVVGINGNMVSVEFDGNVTMNEVGYVNVENKKLKGEEVEVDEELTAILATIEQ